MKALTMLSLLVAAVCSQNGPGPDQNPALFAQNPHLWAYHMIIGVSFFVPRFAPCNRGFHKLSTTQQLSCSIILVEFDEFNKIKNHRLDEGWKPRSLAYQSDTLTITLNCFLCLCEAVSEPYSYLGDFFQFI